MKSIFLKLALGAALVAGAAPAFANLIRLVPDGTQNTGTGLGAVSTVVTVQDNGGNAIESGCVSYPGGSMAMPSTACQMPLLGGDNTAGSGGNNTYFLNALNTIGGLTSASQLGFVVNISEGGPGGTATLTDLYLSLYNTRTNTFQLHAYIGPDLILGDGGGIGQSGMYNFVLDADQATAAAGFCRVLSECVVGGGIQFAQGTTSASPETLYVTAFSRGGTVPVAEVPEPGSVALLGLGAMAFGLVRRRRAGKR